MIGSITADGEVIAITGTYSLGSFLMTRLGYIGTDQEWRFTENNLIVGQYQAVAIDMQGISPQQLETLQSRLEGTQTALEAEEYGDLTKHDVFGDLLQAAIQGYLGTTYALDRVAAQAADIVYLRRPSYGTFSTHVEVAYFFGVPQTVLFSGAVMDADRMSMNTEHQGNCFEDWIAFNRASGFRNSALENQLPEQLFSTAENQIEGSSTAKAFALATAEGQKMYTLTSANSDQLDNITIDDGARAEIVSGLALGLEVTVHEAPITVGGWTGSGYTILDPDFGVGAYKISGGASGAEFVGAVSTVWGTAITVFDTGLTFARAPDAILKRSTAVGAVVSVMSLLSTFVQLGQSCGIAAAPLILGAFIAAVLLFKLFFELQVVLPLMAIAVLQAGLGALNVLLGKLTLACEDI